MEYFYLFSFLEEQILEQRKWNNIIIFYFILFYFSFYYYYYYYYYCFLITDKLVSHTDIKSFKLGHYWVSVS